MIECLPTRQKHLIKTCGKGMDSETIKTTIGINENAQQKINIRKRRRRIARIIIFGALEAPSVPQKLLDPYKARQQQQDKTTPGTTKTTQGQIHPSNYLPQFETLHQKRHRRH